MVAANDIYNRGPEAACEHFQRLSDSAGPLKDEMDVKEFADICWTTATAAARLNVPEAKKWAAAALAGYALLSRRAAGLAAESASETAEILRRWKLLAENPPLQHAPAKN